MADQPAPPSFEAALTELERVVRDLEDGQIGLEQALASYEHGVGLLKHCYGLLQQAEQRILILTGEDDSGQPLTEPFEPGKEANGKPISAEGKGKRQKRSERTEPDNGGG
jgi:exodeoxyribonuclease VII small subunit